MRSYIFSLIFLTFLSLHLTPTLISSANAEEKSKTVVIAVPNNVFANLKFGEAQGIIAEATDVILKEMGYETSFISMPSAEMKEALIEKRIDVMTSVLQPSRQDQNILYSNPVLLEYNVIVTLNDKSFELNRIEDLYGKKIGARVGFKYPLIDKDGKVNLIRNREDSKNMRSLFLGDLDAVIIAGASDLYELRAEGIMNRLEVLNKAVGYVRIGSALSRERFSLAHMNLFNKKLMELRNREEWQDILSRNGFLNLVKEWPLIED